MSAMRLGVALCTYNGQRYLQVQLDSLLAQQRLPDEIVIGDDASTDDTRVMLRDFVRQAKEHGVEVRLIERAENVGFVENFAATLREARADVVFLCDQDDVWQPQKLAVMSARFEAEPDLGLLCSDARLVDGEGKSLRVSAFEALALTGAEKASIRRGDAFDVLLRRSMVTGATAAIRADLLPTLLPVGEGWIHDEWLAIAAAAVSRVDVIEQPLIDYRQHHANQIGMRRRTWKDRWRDIKQARGEEFRLEIRKMDALRERLQGLGVAGLEAKLKGIESRRVHFAARVAIGARPPWRRAPAILEQAAAGLYRRFGTGGRSMLRDLLRRD